jgi:hypothetical protein
MAGRSGCSGSQCRQRGPRCRQEPVLFRSGAHARAGSSGRRGRPLRCLVPGVALSLWPDRVRVVRGVHSRNGARQAPGARERQHGTRRRQRTHPPWATQPVADRAGPAAEHAEPRRRGRADTDREAVPAPLAGYRDVPAANEGGGCLAGRQSAGLCGGRR